MDANSPTADRSHRLARQALCREIADSIALHDTLDAVFDTASKCFTLCQANNTCVYCGIVYLGTHLPSHYTHYSQPCRLKDDDHITREAFEALGMS